MCHEDKNLWHILYLYLRSQNTPSKIKRNLTANLILEWLKRLKNIDKMTKIWYYVNKFLNIKFVGKRKI